MKIIKVLIIIILIINSDVLSQKVNSNFDFTGITEFYKIVNILGKNEEPSQNEWNNLFNTPGYKVLVNGEFSKDFFKRNFRLVFMPSKSKELLQNLRNKNSLSFLLHYVKVRDNKRKMLQQLRKLQSIDFNRKAINRTLQFLPQNNVTEFPPVAFVIFENNGRGSSPIIVDLAASIEWDFVSFLSHEFHHWYRNRQMKFNYRNVASKDMYLVEALDHIEAEGIADMVDKRDWFSKSSNSVSKYARQFINDVGRTPFVIKQMDKLFSEAGKNKNRRRLLGSKMLNLLPQKGHTTGYFMASLILEQLGKRKLIACLGNPFKFILTYNSAAKLSRRYPAFSYKALETIKEFENKYVK